MTLTHVIILLPPDMDAANDAADKVNSGDPVLGETLTAGTKATAYDHPDLGPLVLLRGDATLAPLYNHAVGVLGWGTVGSGRTIDGIPQHLDNPAVRDVPTGKAYMLVEAPTEAAVLAAVASVQAGSLQGLPLTSARAGAMRIPNSGPFHLVVLGDAAEVAAIWALPKVKGWLKLASGPWDDDFAPEHWELAYAWGYVVGSGGA